MNHYQKLATLVLRLVTFVFVLLGLMGMFYYLIAPHSEDSGGRFLSSIGFTVFGLIGFFLSPLLGRLIGKDL
ncbi:MAG: hypothetical protein ACRYFS_01095 [Janthinobacterium lividum]